MSMQLQLAAQAGRVAVSPESSSSLTHPPISLSFPTIPYTPLSLSLSRLSSLPSLYHPLALCHPFLLSRSLAPALASARARALPSVSPLLSYI